MASVLLAAFLILNVLIAGVYLDSLLPTPTGSDAAPRVFSEARAFEHGARVQALGPRPVGSAAEVACFAYLRQHLERVRLTAERSGHWDAHLLEHSTSGHCASPFATSGGAETAYLYTALPSLALRLTPITGAAQPIREAVMVAVHTDSVHSGPGGFDTAANMGVMLETAANLAGSAPRGAAAAVVFMFQSGEEDGLIGAQGLVAQHPWLHPNASLPVRAFLNLESIGVGGSTKLFQASRGGRGRALVELWSRARDPRGSGFAADVFDSGLINSDTDFRVYAQAGLAGLDFAFLEQGPAYHTERDRIEGMRAGSLEQLGRNLRDFLDAVLQLGVPAQDSPDTPYTFYTVPGVPGMVLHGLAPPHTAPILLLLSLVLLYCPYKPDGAPAGPSDGTMFGLAAAPLAAYIGVGLSWAASLAAAAGTAAATALRLRPLMFVSRPAMMVAMFAPPALAAMIVVQGWASAGVGWALGQSKARALGPRSEGGEACWRLHTATCCLWLQLLALVVHFQLKGQFLVFYTALLPLSLFTVYGRRPPPAAAAALAGAPGTFMAAANVAAFLQVLLGMAGRLDRTLGAAPVFKGDVLIAIVIAAATVYAFGHIAPAVACRPERSKWTKVLVLVPAAAIVYVAMASSMSWTAEQPRPIMFTHIFHVEDLGPASSAADNYLLVASPAPGSLDPLAAHIAAAGRSDIRAVCADTTAPQEPGSEGGGESAIAGIDASDLLNARASQRCTIRSARTNQRGGGLDAPFGAPGGPTGWPTVHMHPGSRRAQPGGHQRLRLDTAGSRRWILSVDAHCVERYAVTNEAGVAQAAADRGEGPPSASDARWIHTHSHLAEGHYSVVKHVGGPQSTTKFSLWLLMRSQSNCTGAYGLTGSMNGVPGVRLRADFNMKTVAAEDILHVMPNWVTPYGKSTLPWWTSILAALDDAE